MKRGRGTQGRPHFLFSKFSFLEQSIKKMQRDLCREDCDRDCNKQQEKVGNDDSHRDCNKQQEKLFSRCERFSHCRAFLLTLSSAVLCNIVVRPAMSAPIRKDKSIWGDGSLRDGIASSARWGKGEGGVPTKDELHKMFPPIPINVSVSPVVLVPGIGGSIMTVNEGVNTGLQVWIRLYEATYYFQRYMWGRFNDSTKTLEPFSDLYPSIGPVESGYGLDGIRNLDPSVHWPIYNYLVYFDTIISVLESQGWLHGKTLFGVPWDWRQSMCWPPTLKALEAQIRRAQDSNGGRKVTLVTHSMGALVTKCLLRQKQELFDSSVERWIAIAAPHQGAGAKILLEFLQGYNLGNIVIDAEDAKVLSLASPAVYELLPQMNFSWVTAPYISVGWKNGSRSVFSEGAGVPPQLSYAHPIRQALAQHTMTLPDTKPPQIIPQPLNEACWQLSQETRGLIANVGLPQGVLLYNLYGVGQETWVGLNFSDIGDLSELETAKYTLESADGDGTVAVESAAHPGIAMPVRAQQMVKADHMSILMHPDTLSFILDALYQRI